MWSHVSFKIGILAAVILASACSRGGGSDKGTRTRPPPMVSVSKVESRNVNVEAHAPVDLRPLAQADVGSKTLGYLDAVLVDRGDKVKKGQLLAMVRPSDLPDQLAAARGSHAQTQANVALARANHERAQQLAPSGVVSQQQLQQTAAALATAEAQETAARAQMGALGVRLGETRIQSPLDGVVAMRRLDPGALVGPTAGTGTILTVARIDTLRVYISVHEREAAGVTIGKDAHVELDALPGKSFTGKVVRLAPGFDSASRTLEAEVHLANADGALRPGMYGRGAVVLDVHPNVPVLPVAAMQMSNKQKYVFVLAGGDKVQRRSIETGYDGGNWVEVTSGLKAGEEVVMAGAEGLADGAAVRVVRDIDPYSGQTRAEKKDPQNPDKVPD